MPMVLLQVWFQANPLLTVRNHLTSRPHDRARDNILNEI
jgi:hypothetical protein